MRPPLTRGEVAQLLRCRLRLPADRRGYWTGGGVISQPQARSRIMQTVRGLFVPKKYDCTEKPKIIATFALRQPPDSDPKESAKQRRGVLECPRSTHVPGAAPEAFGQVDARVHAVRKAAAAGSLPARTLLAGRVDPAPVCLMAEQLTEKGAGASDRETALCGRRGVGASAGQAVRVHQKCGRAAGAGQRKMLEQRNSSQSGQESQAQETRWLMCSW